MTTTDTKQQVPADAEAQLQSTNANNEKKELANKLDLEDLLIDNEGVVTTTDATGAVVSELTPEQKRIMRKVDWHVLPILCGFYFFQAIDKGNIGLAKLGGIQKDTGSTGTIFNVIVSMFFVGYILVNIPSNLILQRVSPRIWIAFIGLGWGVAVAAMAWAKDVAGLMVGRFFLGVFEAGILPASLLITATWYPRYEHAYKTGVWFCFSSIGSALGGIISWFIQKNLTGGYFHPWAYLLLIEGGATVLWALLAFFITPDIPERAKFLTDDERLYVLNRLKADRSQTKKVYVPSQNLEAWLDVKTWMLAVIYFCWQGVNTAFSLFGPAIIKGLGATDLNAQLLAAPYAVFNFILQLIISYTSDKSRDRSLHLISAGLLSVAGYLTVILYTPQSGNTSQFYTLYGVLFLTSFNPGSLTLILGWTTNLLVGHTKRVVAVSIIVIASAFGGLCGSYIYQDSDAPLYHLGHSCNMSLMALGLLTAGALRLYLIRENKLRDAKYGNSDKVVLAKDLDELQDDFTDKDPSFRYVL
ncbi:hypothetical protein HDU76_012562 [Blyttiomyces sp. JEL0837]|nr:hypothetical protein HDU76_012562 [Blyttiomyces sp. JEL0837]